VKQSNAPAVSQLKLNCSEDRAECFVKAINGLMRSYEDIGSECLSDKEAREHVMNSLARM